MIRRNLAAFYFRSRYHWAYTAQNEILMMHSYVSVIANGDDMIAMVTVDVVNEH